MRTIIHSKVFYYVKFIIEPLKVLACPEWFLLLIIFFVLYLPFLKKYGWEYRSIIDYDLPSFYAASVSVFRNEESPYNPESLQNIMGQDYKVYPYLYPPPSLFFFYPLSIITFRQAHRFVLLINHLLFLVLIWVIPLYQIRTQPRYRAILLSLSLVISLTFFPIYSTLAKGQVNILLLMFIVIYWLLSRRGDIKLAALFLALAVFLKTYPLIIIPMLFLIGRRKEVLYTFLWLGLGVIISLIVLPNTLWHAWLNDILPTGGYARTPIGLFSPADISNQSLNGVISRAFMNNGWFHPLLASQSLVRIIMYVTALLVIFITGLAVWRSRGHSDSLDNTLLISLPVMFLIAPFSWVHHLVYLLPTIILLPSRRFFICTVRTISFLLLWLATTIFIGISDWFQYKFFGVVVLWGLCLWDLWNKDAKVTL